MDQIVIEDINIRRGIILLLNHNFYDDIMNGDLYQIIPLLKPEDLTEFKMYIVFQDVNEKINDSIYIEWHTSASGLKKNTNIQ